MIVSDHLVAIDGLPPIHKDPFDRWLVAQGMVEEVTLLTVDPLVARCSGSVRKLWLNTGGGHVKRSAMLRQSLCFGFVFVALFQPFPANSPLCKFSDATTVVHIQGTSVPRLTITEPCGSFGTTPFVTDADDRQGALFSPSSIHGNEANTNLLKLAWALARAGVTVHVLDGAREW